MNKKLKVTMYVVGILWIAVLSQVVVNKVFMDDARIIDAFIDTDSNIEESKLNLVINYGNEFLLNNKKEEILDSFAQSAGIDTYEVSKEYADSASTMKIEEKRKGIETSLELITITRKKEQENISYNYFILLQMKFSQNYKDVITYKKKIEKCIHDMKVKDYQCIMKFTGSYKGELSTEEKDKKVKELLKSLEARKIESISSDNYYTAYAYTGLVEDYIEVAGKRININIATTYNEEEDKTELYLATPILNEDY